jgi:hypothetical protein
MTFQKGVSGNPAGREPTIGICKKIARRVNKNGETDGADLSPDQRLGLQGLADSGDLFPGRTAARSGAVQTRGPGEGGTDVDRTVSLRSTLRRIRGTAERRQRMAMHVRRMATQATESPSRTSRSINGLACTSLLIPRIPKTKDGWVPLQPIAQRAKAGRAAVRQTSRGRLYISTKIQARRPATSAKAAAGKRRSLCNLCEKTRGASRCGATRTTGEPI